MPTQFPGQSSIDMNQLCSPDGPLYHMMNTLIKNHFQTYTANLELSIKNQFGVIQTKMNDLSNKIDFNSKQIASLTGHFSKPSKPDEAKKGEKTKEPMESLEARKKARVAIQERDQRDQARKEKLAQQFGVSIQEIEDSEKPVESQGHNEETSDGESSDEDSENTPS